MQYNVITTIQSVRDPEANLPVEVPYYRGESLAQAMSAMATAAVFDDSDYVRTLSVRLDFIPLVAEQHVAEAPFICDGCAEAAARDCDHDEVDPPVADDPVCVLPEGANPDDCTEHDHELGEVEIEQPDGSVITDPAPWWDFEQDVSLSDCEFYRQPRKDGECSGPRVGVRIGGVLNGLVRCEHHVNQYPLP